MKKTLLLILGVAIGAAATFKLAKNKYEKLAQEEIDSVKERFSDMKKTTKNEEVEEKNNDIHEEVSDEPQNIVTNKYRNLASDYTKSNNTVKTEPVSSEVKEDEPYVINSDEFGEYDDYEQACLLYFSDGTLTDDNYDLVDDIDFTVGQDNVSLFEVNDIDELFVRNDRLKCDYEITLDHRTYADIIESMPYIVR